MTDFPSIPESLQPKMEMVWRAARCVCDNILDFHPDVIVALMHSGWGMAFAGKVLWDHTQAGPFPPIARVNLGREKITVFTEMHNLEEVCFAGIYTSGYVVGKLLAWLYTHLDWRMQLRGHVSAALPAGIDPQRILVVDDCIHEGSTAMVALSLLERVYPLAQLRYLDTHGWYRSDYQKFMLSAFDFCREAFPETSALSRELINSLDTVAVGSEDVSMDSLDWRPVTVDSPDVQALRDYAPPEQWVQVAPQIYAAIARYIGGRAADYTPAAPEVNSIKFQLAAEWLIMRDIWLENGLTRRQVQQRYGFTEQQVVTFLRRHIEYDELAVAGYGRGARYVIPPGLRLKVETPQADDSEDDPLEAYCLLPGRLFFGEHLGYYEAAETHAYSRNLVRKVLALGVDCWLDVQVWARGGVIEDNPLFLEEAQAMGRDARVSVFPQPYAGWNDEYTRRHKRKLIRQIMDQIDQLVSEGRMVYVSCLYNETFRAIVAGCYLARHGQTGRAALDVLQACRAAGPDGWKREPASFAARRYIRAWPAGL